MALSEQLLAAIKGVYAGLDVRVVEVPHRCSYEGISLEGNFYYLTFRNGAPTVDEFAEYIYHRVIPYCLPRKIRSEKDQKYRSTGDPRYIHELTDQARHLFAKARATRSKSGEPGEVILFVLLEAFLKAPQIACKMYLKTSEEMPVHGSDGVHLACGSTASSLRLIWGESKLFERISSAFDDIFESVGKFLSSNAGRTPRERDLDIVRDHTDVEDPVLKEALMRYFDPYASESLQLQEVFACFVGFEYWPSSVGGGAEKENVEAEFRKAYSERIASACDLFVEKMKSAGLQHLVFHILLIPFPSVSAFRAKFFQHLGVSHTD